VGKFHFKIVDKGGMGIFHKSVLLKETIESLNIAEDGIYIDATLGGGGHALEIARRLKTGFLIGVDQDSFAIGQAAQVLSEHLYKVRIIRANFKQIEYIKSLADISYVDGILMDLGVSSFQLDDEDRGFSYKHDAYLDMRMDGRQKLSAYDIVNGYSEKDLASIFLNYSEEKWAARIAKFISNRRNIEPINTTFQLVDIIKAAIPKAAREGGPHPAKRVFQAIRIEVNDELGILEEAISDYIKILRPGGRICVITFHSLEDRLVKNVFRKLAESCTCPREFPVCICDTSPSVEIITKKPIIPSNEEIIDNHRARSAKLRVAQKLASTEDKF